MQQPPASTLRQVCPLAPLPLGPLNRLLRGSIAGPLAGFGMRRGFIREIPDPSRSHGKSGPSRGRSRGSRSVWWSFAGFGIRREIIRGNPGPSRSRSWCSLSVTSRDGIAPMWGQQSPQACPGVGSRLYRDRRMICPVPSHGRGSISRSLRERPHVGP